MEYCPTLQMLADYFTKPLQGSQFQILRNRIMNYNPEQQSAQDYRSVLDGHHDQTSMHDKTCVGDLDG